MASPAHPTAPKRWISATLKREREKAGLKPKDVQELLGCTHSWVSHLDSGRNLPSEEECEKLLAAFGLGDRWPFFRDLLAAARTGRNWWNAKAFRGAVPKWFDLYLGLEAWARQAASWNALVVPGILQTRRYARELIKGAAPHLPDAEVERRVDLRMARQAVLEREDPMLLRAIIDEGALRRPVGTPEIMAEQWEQLITFSRWPNIELQVLPSSIGAHVGLDGTFTILDFPSPLPADPGMVYLQDARRGRYVEVPEDIQYYRETFSRLRADACPPADFEAVITRIAA